MLELSKVRHANTSATHASNLPFSLRAEHLWCGCARFGDGAGHDARLSLRGRWFADLTDEFCRDPRWTRVYLRVERQTRRSGIFPRGRRGRSVQVSAVDERSSLTRCPQTQKIRALAAAQKTDEAHASRGRAGQRAAERCEAVNCRLAPARDGRDSDHRVSESATRTLAGRRLSGTVQDSRGRRVQVSSATVRRPDTRPQHENRRGP